MHQTQASISSNLFALRYCHSNRLDFFFFFLKILEISKLLSERLIPDSQADIYSYEEHAFEI